jgi:hypothetical protein
MDCIENTSPNSSSLVASCRYRTDHVANIDWQFIHCCMIWICCLAMGMFAGLYPSNSSLCWLHSYCLEKLCHIGSFLRLLIPISLQACRHFSSDGTLVTSVIGLAFLPHGSILATITPAPPSLKPFVLSSSLIRCQPVQVYHHHPRSRVPLDPVHHNIYPRDCPVWTLPWGLKLGWLSFHVGGLIEPHFVTSSTYQ